MPRRLVVYAERDVDLECRGKPVHLRSSGLTPVINVVAAYLLTRAANIEPGHCHQPASQMWETDGSPSPSQSVSLQFWNRSRSQSKSVAIEASCQFEGARGNQQIYVRDTRDHLVRDEEIRRDEPNVQRS